jgi:hypothetical protein
MVAMVLLSELQVVQALQNLLKAQQFGPSASQAANGVTAISRAAVITRRNIP